jgi:co-chaperonin GroES (HSP10)
MPKAVTDHIWSIRDKTESEKSGILIPGSGREKPHTATVHSIGSLVKDKDIKASKGKKIIFHKTIGQEIEYGGITYLILHEHEIIGVD